MVTSYFAKGLIRFLAAGVGDKKHTFMKRILFLFIIFLVSCRSVSSVQEFRSLGVQKFRSVDTVVLRDSVYRHDSVIYRERTIHDTVYITKEVYRDRLEARGERRKAKDGENRHGHRDRVARARSRKASRAICARVLQVVHYRPMGDWAIGNGLLAIEVVGRALFLRTLDDLDSATRTAPLFL